MYKAIQAFFKSEDDAETVKADLNKLKVNNIRVDKLPEAGRTLMLTPLTYAGNGTTNSGGGAGAGIIGAFTSDNEGAGISKDDSSREYTVECEVEESDYQEALKIIMEQDGHMDRDALND